MKLILCLLPCNKTKSTEDFYIITSANKYSPYCKPCTGDQVLERQRIFKKLCVEYKGGKCINCGYNKYIGALEFHHRDPTKKEFGIANHNLRKFDDRIKLELDKCELLCANCHREAHSIMWPC